MSFFPLIVLATAIQLHHCGITSLLLYSQQEASFGYFRDYSTDFFNAKVATVPVRRLCLVLVMSALVGLHVWLLLLLLLLPRYNASVVRGWPPLVSTVSNLQLYQVNLTTKIESELYVVGWCVETHSGSKLPL